MDEPLWSEGASAFAHEREALAFVRSRLPNHEPYRAWSNVEFIADNGTVNEIDLLVITPMGFFLVEIKSFPGVLTGDNQRWRVRFPRGGEKSYDHPLILTNAKAKRLSSLLQRQKALRNERLPFLTPLVFLSSAELDVRLHGIGKTGVAGRGPGEHGADQLPGIIQTIKDPTSLGKRGHAVDRPMSRAIAEAIRQAGLLPSNRGRKVGDWELGDPIDEGPGWQDFAARRPALNASGRARIYLAGTATSREEEDRLRQEADQEYRLIRGIRHAGILHPDELVQSERGPAVVFEYAEGEERLDLWAPDHLGAIPLDDRIELVRQLGEAVQHAHAEGITHRALTARSVTVRPAQRNEPLRLLIGHWHAGSRELASRLTRLPNDNTVGPEMVGRLADAEQVYLAPELFAAERPDGVALDTFSLGALAYLLLTGRPPAQDLADREETLTASGHYVLDADFDSPPDSLALFVASATAVNPAHRPQPRELLELLDEALEELTAPGPADVVDAQPADTVDPLTAHQGSVLEGGWRVLKRLGSGSTAVALLCERDGAPEPEVLKVAKDEDHAERLRDEHRTLVEFNHPCVVVTHGIERIGGRTTLRLAPAGDPADKYGMTLADRLRNLGPLELDLLERFGDDLLDVVKHLETDGVIHRDIKPENIGVRARRGDRSLHLVLYDFSLSHAADTSVQAGTPGYLDPFLAERPNRRWDPAAERYAAAVTLYEMATATRPVWGDGRTNPIHLADRVPTLDVDLFDPSVRDGLIEFFTKALHRDFMKRFHTAAEMRQAWGNVFLGAARTATTHDEVPDEETLERLAALATEDTPVAELGLTGSAVSTLERLGINNVRQLLEFPLVRLYSAGGVGKVVSRQITDAVARLRDHLDTEPSEVDGTVSIDTLAKGLVARPSTPQAKADLPRLTFLLGLHEVVAKEFDFVAEAPVEIDQRQGALWPAFSEAKQRFGVSRAEFDELMGRARNRWVRNDDLKVARKELHDLLARAGGVLPADELALALLAQRGSTATGPLRLVKARAVVRAALEADAGRKDNRFTWRRLGGGASAVVALSDEELEGEELADYAASLGKEADAIAEADPLLTEQRAADQLRGVAPPAGLAPLSNHRLIRLAAAASHKAAVSSRLELYPRGLGAERAVRLARAALLSTGVLPENEVRSRVATRFPEAEPLPSRPALDTLLHETAGLVWVSEDDQGTGYRIPLPTPLAPSAAMSTSFHRLRTGTVADVSAEEREQALGIHERLQRNAANGGYLVLTVKTSKHEAALAALRRYGPSVVSADHLVLDALQRHAEAKRIKWNEAILTTDAAGPTGPQWDRLKNVVREALAPVEQALLHDHEHVLLIYPGLLARYDQMGMLARLAQWVTRIPADGQRLRTLWVLVPTNDPAAAPVLDTKAVPVTSSAEHLVLGDAWLENLHTAIAPAALS